LLLTAFGAFDLDRVNSEGHEGRQFVYTTTLGIAVLYILAITFIKLSILSFYRRTFTIRETWFRWCWALLLVLVLLWTSTCIILLALQETGTMPGGGFMRLGISTTGMVNGFSDLFLMILPTVMVSRLKLQNKQKIALISIFGIGGMYVPITLHSNYG
jgi:cytochrome bd-type quinol oxidase subunit 2